jgi:hypothetical protein
MNIINGHNIYKKISYESVAKVKEDLEELKDSAAKAMFGQTSG